jgi:branched-chain amino acid transport system substrate-binding protein
MHAGRWRFAAAVIGMTAMLALTSCGQASSQSSTTGAKDTTPIKVGTIVSLTGTYAGIGTPEKQVIEMEVKKINDAGGINGRKIEMVYEDDATDEAKAVAAAAKLIEQDKVVAILGPSGSGQSMAIRGDVDRAGIPNISMAGASVLVDNLDKLQFTTAWTNKIVVPYTLDFLQKQGIKNVAIIADTSGYGKDGVAVINSEAAKYGIKVVSTQTFNPGDTDMTAQLTKIKGTDAQAILLWNAGKEAAIVLKNAKDLGIKTPIYGSHGNARKELIEGAGDASEGFKFAAGKVLLPETYGTDTEQYKIAKDFIERYVAAYTDPPSTFAGHAFDAFNVLTNALKSTNGDTDPVKLRDAVEATKDLPGVGGMFTYSPTDHGGLSTKDVQMYVIKNGTWQLAQ